MDFPWGQVGLFVSEWFHDKINLIHLLQETNGVIFQKSLRAMHTIAISSDQSVTDSKSNNRICNYNGD